MSVSTYGLRLYLNPKADLIHSGPGFSLTLPFLMCLSATLGSCQTAILLGFPAQTQAAPTHTLTTP